MNAQLLVLTGATAGRAFPLSRPAVSLGRHPASDLQFDPTGDPEVSRHHALIAREGDRWFVRDLRSRHGTFLNGRRIAGDHYLTDGDRIHFGSTGPVVEFRIRARVEGRITGPRGPLPAPSGSAAEQRVPTPPARQPATRLSRALRRPSLVLAVALPAVVGGFLVSQQRQRTAWEDEPARERVDSLRAVSDSMAQAREVSPGGLADTLPPSRGQVHEAGMQVARADNRGNTAPVVPPRQQPPPATAALDRQQPAAALDLRAIQRANRSAVAMVYVETEEGEVSSATAFAVRADATLLTSRHVVAGAEGRQRVRRMAVQFSDSEQVWPARLLLVSHDTDLALVKVDNILGEVPTIRSLNLRPDTIAPGSPVALIGFARGGDLSSPNSERGRTARPLVGTGVVSAVSPGRIEVQGYGAAGASGGPIFDANGEVIAILFGGQPGASSPLVFGVPASAAAELLRRLR